MEALARWNELVARVNGRTTFGEGGVRDPENPCELFDGRGYDGKGDCYSDGHYLCERCSHLAPDAPRFTEYGRSGRGDRLRLFWHRPGGPRRREGIVKKAGCCFDGACNTGTCMVLPTEQTCADCQHYSRCQGLFGCKPGNTTCDFFPRRFLPNAEPRTREEWLTQLAADASEGRALPDEIAVVLRELREPVARPAGHAEQLAAAFDAALDRVRG